MTFTFDELKQARERGYSDDEIWNTLASEDKEISLAKDRGYSLEEVTSIVSGKPIPEPEPSGTSFGKEVSQLGPAFVESIGRPLENMGESFEAFGFTGVADALKKAITEPENYVSAGQRFMEPAPDESQFMGFAWQYAPRAAVEQVGQAIGAIGTRAVGAAAGGAVAGPPGAVAGGFVGPAIFGAAQVIGPVAKERAKNNGREVPNNEDLVAATLTAIGSGSLDAIGARYLPGGDKATGKFFKRVASSFVGEGVLTETPQSFIEQIGSTAGTEKGLNINVKQAVGEGLIGGTSAAGLTAIVSPFSKPVDNQVIRTPEQAEELDIDAKANQEAILLMGDPADQTQNERITKLKEIESVIANNETLMSGLEPNAPERTKLDLENRAAIKEAERLKLEIKQSVGLSEPITEAERQQAELAKAIVEEPAPTEPLPVPPAQAAPVAEAVTPVAAPVEQVVTPPVEVAPLPQRTVAESIQNKDTFEFEGMRGAVTLEDGTAVFRPFGTNDKYEVPINPNQAISEIEGIQWVRKGQTRQAPVEPTIPEVAAIVESQPQITEEEFNATEDDFQLPPSLIEIEKSPTLNAIADIFNTGESKIVQEGKRAKKVSATPEFYRQISPEQIDVANRQIDNALRIIDNLPVSEEQKQALAEPYLLIDQDISSYENNPEYKQYKASIRREVRPADQAVTLPKTISEVEAGVKELKQRAARPTTKPVITKEPPVSMVGKEVIPGVTPTPITPAPVTEQAAPAEAPAPEVAPTPAVSETITEPVTPTRKEAKFPTMPSIEEQTAEKVYGGETGLYDPFAGVQKKRTKAEDPAGRRGTEEQIKNADEHAAEIGGTVLYQDGDISLIRGYSIWGGTPIYIVANKGIRSRIDISSYKGNLTTPEQKAQLVDIKNKIEAEDQASFNNKPFITFTDGIAFSSNVPSAIAGVLKGWKSLLNIKANLYVTTYEDAVADKDKFNGPHRVIGSAGLASSKTDGSIRKMPNGDFYIMFRGIPSRTKMLETLAHELGHLHEKEAFDNASLATKKMLRDEHDKWVKSQTGKTAQELVSSLRAVKTAKANLGAAEGRMADDLSAYWKSFGEWYADQVSRWAVSSEKPLTIVDKFFSKIAKALRDFYSKITNQGYLPNETFVKYLERTLREPERIVSEPITIEGELEQLSQQLGEQPSKTTRRTRIMGVEAGEEVETQEAIIARTKDLLRKRFDPTKVTDTLKNLMTSVDW
jgi:hypothetical protein